MRVALPQLVTPCSRAASMIAMGASSWKAEIPNALTIGRVAAVPVLAGAFCAPQSDAPSWVPAVLFAACAFTDWLDGYLARRWNVASAFGAFLDPVADKLLVCTCLLLLSYTLGAVVVLPTSIIVCREVTVSALREWMGKRGKRDVVAVGWWGKLKTAVQMCALQLLLLAPCMNSQEVTFLHGGLLLLYIAAVLTCSSAVGYIKAAWPILQHHEDGL